MRISDFYIAGGCVSFLASAGFMAWICAYGVVNLLTFEIVLHENFSDL